MLFFFLSRYNINNENKLLRRENVIGLIIFSIKLCIKITYDIFAYFESSAPKQLRTSQPEDKNEATFEKLSRKIFDSSNNHSNSVITCHVTQISQSF